MKETSEFGNAIDAMASCYAHTTACETGRDPEKSGSFSREEMDAIRNRCALFVEEAVKNGIAAEWTEEVWATAGDVLADQDGGFSGGVGRQFADDCEEHDLTEEMAERADNFLRGFLIKHRARNDTALQAVFDPQEGTGPSPSM